ncbi:MAG: ATP-binding protein [Chloracidobacterium sp.]|nr:ATP-binding protein [Chloracidobacterium sp.]MCO5333599.1 ATP-binding protein [Pyrinomonadaceae bacterium]
MSNNLEIKLRSRLESVDEAARSADEFAKSCGFDEEFRYALDLAVRESVANAVKHGNKFDESLPVEVRFDADDDAFEISVRDHGAGFDIDGIPDPRDPENLLKANGRGILFMNSFMDEIRWLQAEGGGTEVKMVKRK